MIGLTRLNGHAVVVNAELIETVESTPDTVLSLVTGKKFVVLESVDEVVDKVMSYRRKATFAPLLQENPPERPVVQAASQHED